MRLVTKETWNRNEEKKLRSLFFRKDLLSGDQAVKANENSFMSKGLCKGIMMRSRMKNL